MTSPSLRHRFLVFSFCAYAVSTLLAMAPMSLGAVLLLLAILWEFGGAGRAGVAAAQWVREEVQCKRYLKFSLAFVGVCLLSLLAAAIKPMGYGGHFVEIKFWSDVSKIWYFFWPIVIGLGLRRLSVQEHHRVLRTWFLAFGVLSVLGVVQYFTGWPRPQGIPGNEGRYHATLFLGHHLSVASIWIFPFFMSLDLWANKNLRLNMHCFETVLLSLSGGATLFLTYSRTLWLALPLGIFLWILLTLPRKKAGIAALILGITCIIAAMNHQIQVRLHDAMGVGTRQDLWEANLAFLRARPWLGGGWRHTIELSGYYLQEKYPGASVFSGHAHNNLIDALGSTGFLGAGAWIAWSGFVFMLAWSVGKKVQRFPFGMGLFCAWVVFHINGLTQVNFWEGKVEHQMMWVLGWMLFGTSRRDS